MKTYSLKEVKDKLIGEPGTPQRAAYESRLAYDTMKGILFSTPMVQAIFEDRKTQTRREIKPQPNENGISYMKNPPLDWEQFYKKEWKPWKLETDEGESIAIHSPYQPGDILYVREEHLVKIWAGCIHVEFKDGTKFLYQKHEIPLDTLQRLAKRKTLGKWQRGRFLPKALARIFLKVTAVKAERLNAITEKDAISEGVEIHVDAIGMQGWKCYLSDNVAYTNARDSFKSLWRSINGPDSWAANPYVFAYTFERCEKPQKP